MHFRRADSSDGTLKQIETMVPIAVEAGAAEQIDVTLQRSLDADYGIVDDLCVEQTDSGRIVGGDPVAISTDGRIPNRQNRR